jgi:hypothetical protein
MNNQEKYRWLSSIVFYVGFTAFVLLCAAYDLWVIAAHGEEASISAVMRDLPRLVVFSTGFVFGALVFGLASHFWWNAPDGKKEE